ncbi:MAG: SEL1-like repeat protein, partial [Deltaproteobacteria bacterium]|nr:SEL1-like repeat protein [Deltaproteobacteria bacterium]
MEASQKHRLAHGSAFKLRHRILVALVAVALSSPGAAAQTVARAGSSVWLGIALSDSPESSGPRTGPGSSGPGPTVIRVTPGGPMDKAGVKPGDAILEFNGTTTPDEASFGRILRAIPLGKTVPLRVARGGEVLNLQIAVQSKLQFYRKEADRGDPKSQSELALMYHEGQGAKKDYGEALKWYRKAAEQGHAPAQHAMGVMHSAGLGVRRDPAAAVGWFRKSAAQGNALAENSLGNSYMQGIGVSKDPAEAVKWYRSAAGRGLPEAQHNLGWCYDSGSGVEQNQEEAVQWYAKAADQNYNWSLNALGSKYENGEG